MAAISLAKSKPSAFVTSPKAQPTISINIAKVMETATPTSTPRREVKPQPYVPGQALLERLADVAATAMPLAMSKPLETPLDAFVKTHLLAKSPKLLVVKKVEEDSDVLFEQELKKPKTIGISLCSEDNGPVYLFTLRKKPELVRMFLAVGQQSAGEYFLELYEIKNLIPRRIISNGFRILVDVAKSESFKTKEFLEIQSVFEGKHAQLEILQ